MDIKGPTRSSKYNKVSELVVVCVHLIYCLVHIIVLTSVNSMKTPNFILAYWLCLQDSKAEAVLFQPASEFLPMIDEVRLYFFPFLPKWFSFFEHWKIILIFLFWVQLNF